MPASSSTVLESWDGVSTFTQLTNMAMWTSDASGFTLDASGFTGQCLKSNNATNRLRKAVGQTMMNGYRTGFRYKTSVVTGSTQIAIFSHDSNNGPYAPFYRQGDTLNWSHQGFLISTPSFLVADTWYWIDARFILGNPGGYAEIRINRVVAAAQSGNTSQFVSHTTTANIVIGDVSSPSSMVTDGNWAMDDWYITPDSDGYLGALRIQVKRPNGNGNYSQGVGSDGDSTDNYLLVDEQSTNDSDYVEFTLDGEKDTYAHSGVTAYAAHTPVALQHVARAAYIGASAKKLRRVSRRAGTDSTGSDHTLTNTLRGYPSIITTDAAGGAFDFTNIDATEFGYEQRP